MEKKHSGQPRQPGASPRATPASLFWGPALAPVLGAGAVNPGQKPGKFQSAPHNPDKQQRSAPQLALARKLMPGSPLPRAIVPLTTTPAGTPHAARM